ncbi:hypothetical protein C7N83_13050 [Neisseria iguanae]|uniref:Uncharacterized protein n=1 Tax=Neisseria iguanae TaxID=90242 RepID=A0A2P7TX32_9NEIS|nr:hypothetical protein C7N83_13050 [Neisseria iguanae]
MKYLNANAVASREKEKQHRQNNFPITQGHLKRYFQTAEEGAQVLVMGGQSLQNLMYDDYAEKALSNQGAKVGI